MTQGRPGITRSHVSRHLRPASPTPTAGHQPNRTPPSAAAPTHPITSALALAREPRLLRSGTSPRVGVASFFSCPAAVIVAALLQARAVPPAASPPCHAHASFPRLAPSSHHPSVNRPRDALRRGSGHDNACDHARRWQHLALTPPRTRTPPPSPTPALERPLPTTPSHSPRVAQTASRSLTSRQPAAGYAVRRLPRNPLGSSSPAPRALLHRLRRRELLPVASCPTLQIPSPHCIPRHHERRLIPARRSLARRACALHRDHRRYPRHRRPRDHLAKKGPPGSRGLPRRTRPDRPKGAIDAIKRLIEARFDAVSGANVNDAPASSVPDPSPNKRPAANGVSDSAETDPSASPEPAKKKAKRSTPSEDADARLAAALQAQENSLARARSTRGGGDRTKVVKKKKAPRKKSAKKVGEDDDSEVDGSADSAPKRKGGGGFQKPFILSATLSELCGETQVGHPVWSRSSITGVNEPTQLSRPQVVKKLWEHIKANDLQDPKDKRQIRCDDKMQAVFKQARVDMFRMNKEIGHHLYPVGEE
ncbi:SWIB/MDM2 domain-containingprotein [Purpureocillium lilacinum]|uniref:SWIB/MDM2 domain-containingprotein n=1 Tax=Purpureocillium lilacinum TaxID=33203 RepID=A0A179GJ52_PURLI|nr:SWIB/MDM2 domain-containingprotein [Purpureocillium lilacinum]OAQ77884.1 SWIB/MDM2 domain-containingprotein [Purpureocillium lilacinum]